MEAVSPARAGMVPGNQHGRTEEESFPRASGDGPQFEKSRPASPAFPPRERGWSLAKTKMAKSVYVSPARAGMVPWR